ncbi:MAG: potassium channel family protein [Arachnia sp.]
MARNRVPADGPVVVMGLGRFGKSLALELINEGVEVLGVDLDPKVVQSLAGRLTHVVEADTTNLEAMRQLSVHEFDRAVIGIGQDLESSILTASVVLDLGVSNVWAKAVTASHGRILDRLGVHHVVRPEHDMGKRVAHLVRGRMLDYMEFDDGYAIVKTRPPKSMCGLSLGESTVRTQYGVTVVGVKTAGNGFTHATAATTVSVDDLIIVAGTARDVERFSTLL